MKKIKATIYRGPDDYGIAVDNFEGIFGAGKTPHEAIKSLVDGIEIYKSYNKTPHWFRTNDYELILKFDINWLIIYYRKIFKISAISKYTHISEKKLKDFSQGKSQPTKKQYNKIINGLNKLGVVLASVKFS